MGRCRTTQLKGQCFKGHFPCEKFLFEFQEISSEDNLTRYEIPKRFETGTNGTEISWKKIENPEIVEFPKREPFTEPKISEVPGWE